MYRASSWAPAGIPGIKSGASSATSQPPSAPRVCLAKSMSSRPAVNSSDQAAGVNAGARGGQPPATAGEGNCNAATRAIWARLAEDEKLSLRPWS